MEQNKETVVIEGETLSAVIKESTATQVENAQLKAENEKLEEVAKSVKSEIESMKVSFQAKNEQLEESVKTLQKSIARPSGVRTGNGDEEEVVSMAKSIISNIAKHAVEKNQYDMTQDADTLAGEYFGKLSKKANVHCQYLNHRNEVSYGSEALAKTIRTTDSTSMNGNTQLPTLLVSLEQMEISNPLVASMPTFVVNGTSSVEIIRMNEYGKSIKLAELEDVPSGFDSGITFKKEQAKMSKRVTFGDMSFEAGNVSSMASAMENTLVQTFTRTVARDFSIEMMQRTQDLNQPGFIPYVQNIGTEDTWSYDVNYIRQQESKADNSLVFDKNNRVGYIRSGVSGSLTYDNIVDLIASVVYGDTTGYAFLMNPSTLATFSKLKYLDETRYLGRNDLFDQNVMRSSIANIPVVVSPFMEPIAANKMPIMLVKLDSYLGILKSGQEWIFPDGAQKQVVSKKWYYATFYGTKLLSGDAARGLLLSA